MRNQKLDGIIASRVSDIGIGRAIICLIGLSVVLAIFLSALILYFVVLPLSYDEIPEDDLAKVAEIAGCATGEPAASLWLKAKENIPWYKFRNNSIARRLLVDVDLDRCTVRQSSNANINQRKPGAPSPDNREN